MNKIDEFDLCLVTNFVGFSINFTNQKFEFDLIRLRNGKVELNSITVQKLVAFRFGESLAICLWVSLTLQSVSRHLKHQLPKRRGIRFIWTCISLRLEKPLEVVADWASLRVASTLWNYEIAYLFRADDPILLTLQNIDWTYNRKQIFNLKNYNFKNVNFVHFNSHLISNWNFAFAKNNVSASSIT